MKTCELTNVGVPSAGCGCRGNAMLLDTLNMASQRGFTKPSGCGSCSRESSSLKQELVRPVLAAPRRRIGQDTSEDRRRLQLLGAGWVSPTKKQAPASPSRFSVLKLMRKLKLLIWDKKNWIPLKSVAAASPSENPPNYSFKKSQLSADWPQTFQITSDVFTWHAEKLRLQMVTSVMLSGGINVNVNSLILHYSFTALSLY